MWGEVMGRRLEPYLQAQVGFQAFWARASRPDFEAGASESELNRSLELLASDPEARAWLGAQP